MRGGSPAAAAAPGGAARLLVAPLLFLTAFLVAPLACTVVATDGARGFRAALADPVAAAALWRTLAIAAAVTAIVTAVGTAYALALVTSRGVLRVLLLAALLGGFWVAILVRTLGWLLLYEPGGPLDRALHLLHLLPDGSAVDLLQTTRGMYPAMVHVMLPYLVLPVAAALRELDAEQLRAARSLGAGPLLVLRRVVLPQARSGIVAGAVLVFALSLGFYITPRLLGGPADITVGTLVGDQFEASLTGDVAEPAAVAVLLLAGVLALYAVTDRLLRVSRTWVRA